MSKSKSAYAAKQDRKHGKGAADARWMSWYEGDTPRPVRVVPGAIVQRRPRWADASPRMYASADRRQRPALAVALGVG